MHPPSASRVVAALALSLVLLAPTHLGNTGAQCDAVCTDFCYRIVERPTCGPESDRICG
jgi:hypothetical protein